MASKIKVDQLETADGSGNVTLNNSVTMATGKTLPAASLTGSLPSGMGGKVLQVKYVTFPTVLNTTSTTFSAFSETLAITPTATSSKIYALANIHIHVGGHNADGWSSANLQLFRDTTLVTGSDANSPITNTYAYAGYTESNTERIMSYISKNFQDSPNTTSEITYSIKGNSKNGHEIIYNQFGISNMILLEVGA